jgi:hypothetical protein
LYVKIGFFTILFVLLFVGALVVIRLPQVRITEVVVSGGESVVPPEPVEAIAREVMQGNYGWILPKDNSFLYPKAVIEQEVLNSFPRVKSLSMRRVGLQTLSLELILRKQVALWCGATFTTDRSVPCYSFDDTGVIFEPSLSPGTTTIRYFGVTVGTSTTLFGTQAVREADLRKLALFFIALSGESYQVTDVVLLGGGKPSQIAEEKGLLKESGTETLGPIVAKVIADNPAAADSFKAGKKESLQYLIGQGMKASRGSGDPAVFKDLFEKALA